MEITLDTTTPSSAAFLYTQEGMTMLQHGGICTRMGFSSVVQMDLDTFVATVVPKLARQKSDELMLIRNATKGEYTLVLGDSVTVYKLTSLEDVSIADMMKAIDMPTDKTVYIPDIPFQMIADVKDASHRMVTVRLPEHKSVYKCSALGLDETVYLPPLWARVTMNNANMPTDLRLAVEVDRMPTSMETELRSWPFTNCWREDGRCCLGDTQVSASKKTLTPGDAIQVTLKRFIESDSNPHLIPGYTAAAYDRIETLFNQCKNKDKFQKTLAANARDLGACTLIRTVAIHTEKGAYRSFPYNKLGVRAEAFIG